MLQHAKNYDHTLHPGEECNDVDVVETAGYMTTQQIVEAMLLAGQRLEDYRDAMYDPDEMADDELLDGDMPLTRQMDVDPVDVMLEAERIGGKYDRARAAAEAAAEVQSNHSPDQGLGTDPVPGSEQGGA